jgi:GntR family transcriptional regulator
MRPVGRPTSPLPLYFQVMIVIRENILTGEWAPGTQIPGELDLAQQLGVSVITIRQALGQLVHEGFVKREKAKGTFVNWKGPVRQSANLEVEADDLVTLDRASTSFKLISIEHVPPPKEIQEKLLLGTDEKITRIVRIRLSQGQPLAHVVSYVPFQIGSRIPEKQLDTAPLPIIIETVSAINITEVKHAVAARLSDEEVARHLEIPSGSPVLFVQRDYLHRKETIVRSVGFYRSDLFSYRLTLKRKKH